MCCPHWGHLQSILHLFFACVFTGFGESMITSTIMSNRHCRLLCRLACTEFSIVNVWSHSSFRKDPGDLSTWKFRWKLEWKFYRKFWGSELTSAERTFYGLQDDHFVYLHFCGSQTAEVRTSLKCHFWSEFTMRFARSPGELLRFQRDFQVSSVRVTVWLTLLKSSLLYLVQNFSKLF